MPLTWKAQTLYMQWCLECHRHPEQYLRPKDQVFVTGILLTSSLCMALAVNSAARGLRRQIVIFLLATILLGLLFLGLKFLEYSHEFAAHHSP
jgi:heme/copper-type cytochrome/quinol oxidase subunit 3